MIQILSGLPVPPEQRSTLTIGSSICGIHPLVPWPYVDRSHLYPSFLSILHYTHCVLLLTDQGMDFCGTTAGDQQLTQPSQTAESREEEGK